MKEDINIMSVQVEKLEHNMAKLTITVPAETFNKADYTGLQEDEEPDLHSRFQKR